jgi:DNA-3-methyladenine glycosylase I
MAGARTDAERCPWCHGTDLYRAYHDEEWGVPLRDEGAIFEFLILETFQAGLSWLTILKKRESFRAAFAGFDPEAVARFGDADRDRLLADAGIVRNRAKIDAAIRNARATLALRDAGTPLGQHLWGFVDGSPVVNRWSALAEVPAQTPLAQAISRDLKGRGFAFVGPTVIYAHMQATGMVNDHLVSCFRHGEVQRPH